MSEAPERAYGGARTLVAGGLGFIGSALARRLVSLGAEVAIGDNADAAGGANPADIADFLGFVGRWVRTYHRLPPRQDWQNCEKILNRSDPVHT